MKEDDVGITEYTTPSCKGFVGILKQRFSDFVVREISSDGDVLYLKEIDGSAYQASIFGSEEPAPSVALSLEDAVQGTIDEITKVYPSPLTQEESDSLRSFLTSCHSKAPDAIPNWTGLPCEDKVVRGGLHKAIRVHSADFVESTTEQVDDKWIIKLHAKHILLKNPGNVSTDARGNNNRGGGGAAFVKRKNFQAWPPGVGDYLRFTLMKENVDTISAVNILTKQLHIKPNNICYNGTKDKRGITVQHLTLYRKKPVDFLRINRYFGNPFMRVGDFQYVAKPARLGQLSGNRFEIVLRNIQGDEQDIASACESLKQLGFINYYGLQRFGKLYAGATHKIGKAVLLSDWRQCIEAMFAAPPPEVAAVFAGDELVDVRRHFQNGDFVLAANALPHTMYRERDILMRLAKAPSDFLNAFNTMGRNMRMMYVHAYQSYVWNVSVSERLRRFGLTVVVGDLVRVLKGVAAATDGDVTLTAANKDTINNNNINNSDTINNNHNNNNNNNNNAVQEVEAEVEMEDMHDDDKYTIHRVTEEDLRSGRFTIYDVVLPLLGTESQLPGHSVAEYMLQLLQTDGLSLETFSTCHPAYRMKGNYRAMLQLPGELEYRLVHYHRPDEEINVTELQQFRVAENNNNNNSGKSRKREASAVTSETPSNENETETDAHKMKKSRTEETGQDTVVTQQQGEEANSKKDTEAPKYLALQLKFSLQSGCYATMLLREVMKMSTETSHHATLTSSLAK